MQKRGYYHKHLEESKSRVFYQIKSTLEDIGEGRVKDDQGFQSEVLEK